MLNIAAYSNQCSFLCPYCGDTNNFRVFNAPIGRQDIVMRCDGCDQPVVIQTDVEVKLRMEAFAIPNYSQPVEAVPNA